MKRTQHTLIKDKNILGLLLSIFVLLLSIIFWAFKEQISFESYLNIFGVLILGAVIGNIIFIRDYSFLSPFLITSLSFTIYSINAFYFQSVGVSGGFYLQMLNVPTSVIERIMKDSFFVVLIYYYFYTFGVFLTKKHTSINQPIILSKREENIKELFGIVGIVFFILGTIYFLFYSYRIAGGPIKLLFSLGAIKHLDQISRAPLLLCYNGAYIYFFYKFIIKKDYKSISLYMVILFSFFVYITSGRITMSIKHLIFIIVLMILSNRKKLVLDFKKLVYSVIFIFFTIGIYFFRIYTSIIFSNSTTDKFFSGFDNYMVILGYFMVGKGNLLDIQQFVSLNLYLSESGYTFGKTLFQSVFLSLYQIFNIDYQTPGIMFGRKFFASESGNPVAGAIVELILSFGHVLGAFAFLIIGFLFNWIYQYCLKSNKLLVKAFYAAFFARFLLLDYLKVDSAAFNGFFWFFVPLLLIYFIVYFIGLIMKPNLKIT